MKVDTSEVFQTARLILGTEQVSNKEISAEVWLEVIDQIYHSKHVLSVPCLYKRFGDLTNSNDPFVDFPIARGATIFDKGLGVNTLVRRWPVDTEDYGKYLFSQSAHRQFRKKRILLLVKPESKALLTWALWSIESTLSVKFIGANVKDFKRTLTDSQVKYINKEELLAIFDKQPSVPKSFLSIGIDLDLYARELVVNALEIGQLATRMNDIYERIK